MIFFIIGHTCTLKPTTVDIMFCYIRRKGMGAERERERERERCMGIVCSVEGLEGRPRHICATKHQNPPDS